LQRDAADAARSAPAVQRLVEVVPLRVLGLDKLNFPGSPPFLQPLLAGDCILSRLENFVVDEHLYAVLLGEALDCANPMFVNAARKVRGNADIERAVATAGEDIDEEQLLHPAPLH